MISLYPLTSLLSPAYNSRLKVIIPNHFPNFILITENEITAKKFNLNSFESWAPHLNLEPMEMSELQDLLSK